MESFTMNIDEIPLIHLQIIRYNLYPISYSSKSSLRFI